MTGPIIEIEGGHVLANLEDRTITGRLIPYGEEGRTNVGRFTVDPGTVTLPADPAVLGINLDHDRSQNIGHAVKVWEEADGIYASWQIARTPEGDAALADATSPNGIRKRLSGEFGPAVIRAGKLIAGHARLWGSALVPMGAFPGAMVLAADTPDEPERADADDEHPAIRVVDDRLRVISLPDLPDDITVVTPDGDSGLYTPEATPAEDNTEGGSTVTATTTEPGTTPAESEQVLAEAAPAAAPVPPTQMGGAPRAAEVELRGPNAQQVLAAFAAIRNPLNATPPADAVQVLAALDDITTTGLAGGGEIARPAWMGQLYQGVPYEREYIVLGTLGTAITLAGKQGYTLHRGTSGAPVNILGSTWAGNKTEIASGVGFSKSHASTLLRWAFGADIAREFFDLPGAQEAVEAFFRLVLEDHLIWSDTRALETWRLTGGLPVANKTYPSVDGHDYGTALGQVIQGILAVKAKKADGRRDTPTFIIANELAYEELIYTPKDLVPEFVQFTASTDWQGGGDGLRLVVGDTGIASTSSVIVGSGRSVEFDELPGGPVRIDALDLAKGGVDRAIHGYLQTFVTRPEAVVHIGTPDARANSTAYEVGDLAKVSAVVYQATVAGTSDSSAPTAPAVGATVEDGTVTWVRLI